MSCVQWKRESPRRAYDVKVGERSGSCGCWENNGPEVLFSGSNVSLGQGMRFSPRGLNVSLEQGSRLFHRG